MDGYIHMDISMDISIYRSVPNRLHRISPISPFPIPSCAGLFYPDVIPVLSHPRLQLPSPSTTKLSAFVTDHHRSSPGPSPLVTGPSPSVTESPEDAATGRDDAPVAFRMTPAAAVRRRRVTGPERTAARNSASRSEHLRSPLRAREGGREGGMTGGDGYREEVRDCLCHRSCVTASPQHRTLV